MSAKTDSDWSDLIDIHQRLDSTIMFTLIRFVYSVMSTYFSDPEVALLTVIFVILSGTSMHWKLHPGTILLSQVIFSLSSALLSQAIINISTANAHVHNLTSTHRLLLDYVVVTSLLLAAAVLPGQFRSLPYINRAITLLLYMHTDATEYMIKQLSMGIVPAFFSILLYVTLIRYKQILTSHVTLQYLIKAFNMNSINVVLASAGSVNDTLTDRHTQAVLIILILFIIDALHRVSHALQEGRDFAIWKGSQKLFQIYVDMDIDPIATFSAAVIFIVGKHILTFKNSTLIEVIMLVTVNVILDNLGQYTSFAYNMDKVLTLFMYVIVIHCVSKAIFAKQ